MAWGATTGESQTGTSLAVLVRRVVSLLGRYAATVLSLAGDLESPHQSIGTSETVAAAEVFCRITPESSVKKKRLPVMPTVTGDEFNVKESTIPLTGGPATYEYV